MPLKNRILSRVLQHLSDDVSLRLGELRQSTGSVARQVVENSVRKSPQVQEWINKFQDLTAQAKLRVRVPKELPQGDLPPVGIPTDEGGFFTADDGTPIYYEVTGQGAPLIFCYGLVCRREHWHHQIKHFRNRFKIITFDYRGHHRSGSPANDRNLTLEWCARDIIKLMAHLKIEQAVGLGHSLGVPVLAHLAHLAPEKLAGMVLVCGSVMDPFQNMFFSNRMEVVYQWASTINDWSPEFSEMLWRRLTRRSRLSFFLTSTLGFNPTLAEEGDILLYMEGVKRCTPATFYGLLRDYTSFDGREMLKQISTPTLVLAGNKDCITPLQVQREMAECLAGGTFVEIPEGSHNAHMELPERVNNEIETFLQKLKYV